MALWAPQGDRDMTRPYMNDLMPIILERLKDVMYTTSMFVWFGKHCKTQAIEDRYLTKWGKKLETMFTTWPTI